MTATQELFTPRLHLCAAEPEDCWELHEIWSAPQVSGDQFDGQPPTLESALRFIESSRTAMPPLWVIRSRRTTRAIGSVAMCPFLSEPERSPVGATSGTFSASIRPGLWGHGYAFEAANAVIDHAFAAQGLRSMVARCSQGNGRGRALLERLGFNQVRHARADEQPAELRYLLLSDWTRPPGRRVQPIARQEVPHVAATSLSPLEQSP
jgi:ribosomal-protein-alanine N-acetyltransferase